jgi:glycosyltransferase involved in cell wall biosynthesis
MKITVVTPRYTIAGVPLAQCRFARALSERGHLVELVIGYVEPGYAVSPFERVRVEVWNRPRVLAMLLPLVRYLRRAAPEVVFAAEDHLNTVVLLAAILAGSRARISGSSRVTPFDTYSNRPFSKRWVLKQAARLVMGRADALTCVSQDMVAQYRQVFANPPHVCVYNIVDDRAARQRMTEPVAHPWFDRREWPVAVAAGRLAPWKGFADLIEAMALLNQRRPVRLLILGDGPLRSELQGQIARLGLAERVSLLGYADNPLKYFTRADVFVLSSHVEGMPNVLVEAMMCGCTPVSVDCPTGPRELLQGGRYGYLVPMRDPAALADGIVRALANPIPPAVLAEAVRPFAEEAVIRRHFELLGLTESGQARGQA